MLMDMKTKTILMLIILAITSFSLAAQTVSEKTVKGTTYVITQYDGIIGKEVKNKNGLFDKYIKEISYCPNNIKGYNITNRDLARKIFTKERIKKLAETPVEANISIALICSSFGDVVALQFISVNTDVIAWDEIKALEDACLNIKYVFDTSKCPDAKYFMIAYPINFPKLL